MTCNRVLSRVERLEVSILWGRNFLRLLAEIASYSRRWGRLKGSGQVKEIHIVLPIALPTTVLLRPEGARPLLAPHPSIARSPLKSSLLAPSFLHPSTLPSPAAPPPHEPPRPQSPPLPCLAFSPHSVTGRLAPSLPRFASRRHICRWQNIEQWWSAPSCPSDKLAEAGKQTQCLSARCLLPWPSAACCRPLTPCHGYQLAPAAVIYESTAAAAAARRPSQ